MKQTTRIKTFETNSSSQHSLCIMRSSAKVEDLDSLTYEISCDDEQYGWGYDVLDTPYEILTYLWAMVNLDLYYDKDDRTEGFSEYKELLKNWVHNCKFIEPEGDNWWIDHGYDWAYSISEIFKDRETLANIIFNGRICIWNDNVEGLWSDNDELSEKFVPHSCVKYWVKGN